LLEISNFNDSNLSAFLVLRKAIFSSNKISSLTRIAFCSSTNSNFFSANKENFSLADAWQLFFLFKPLFAKS